MNDIDWAIRLVWNVGVGSRRDGWNYQTKLFWAELGANQKPVVVLLKQIHPSAD
jgi:hypothetical protein